MTNQPPEQESPAPSGWTELLGTIGVGPTVNRTMFVPFAFAIPLACAWLLLGSTRLEISNPRTATSSAEDQPSLKLNPNTATWSDLTLLPRIGEITAKRIVEHRTQASAGSQSPAFRQSSDLEAVRGIGPKTVEGIAPHLKFD